MESQIIQNRFLKAKINRKGAELCSLQKTQNAFEYIWSANPQIWNRHAPILFPFVGKLNNNTYRYDNSEYAMGQHGFARDCNWEWLEIYADLVTAVLDSSIQPNPQYPFSFRLFSTMALQDNELVHTLKVINTGNTPMYFAIGAHPGFALPDPDLSHYVLSFDCSQSWERHLLSDGLFSGKTQLLASGDSIPLHADSFKDDAWVFNPLNASEVTLVHLPSEYQLRVRCKDFPQLGIWTKQADAGFLCIEPWQGIADSVGFKGDISEKTGIVQLPAGEERSWSYSICPI